MILFLVFEVNMKKYIFLFLINVFVMKVVAVRLEEEQYLISILWQQTSAEYRALCLQAYNIAELRINQNKKNANEKAIIVDIDETILDNSPYRASRIKNDDFNQSFGVWVRMADAQAIPGSLDFLLAADKLGYKIFYITNRDEKYRKYTMQNLKRLNFPQVNDKNLFCRSNKISDKTERREKVSENYEIILLIGDNLLDFSQVFYGNNIADRKMKVDEFSEEFGKRFIVLPNPNHGRWKKLFYHRDDQLSEEQKRQLLIDGLEVIE